MNRLFIAVLGFVSLALATVAVAEPAASSDDLRLWFAQPAKQWIDGLPIGNGRMGAMIMGGTADERIQFNECTLWTGQPHDYVRPGALESGFGDVKGENVMAGLDEIGGHPPAHVAEPDECDLHDSCLPLRTPGRLQATAAMRFAMRFAVCSPDARIRRARRSR